MSLIVKRATKGSGLTSSEIDANVNNLNNDKVEINNPTFKAAPSLVNNLIPLTGTVLPAINPSLNLDFANGKQLDPRITFSRNTVATYCDGKTTKLAEQNLLTYSQTPGSTYWTTINMGTLNGTNYTAPDGTLTASLVTSTGVDCYFTQNNYYTAGQSYTFSVYLKADVNTSISFGIGVTYTTAPVTTAWQRFTFNMASATGSRVIIGGMNSWGSGVGIYLWGAQLEQRPFASTYTKTTSAPITNYVSAIIAAPAGVPRFDYDPITKKPLGLLIEELRTNSLLNSTIDGVNLATQDITTTAAARTLSFYGTGSVTLSGRVNILTKTEDFNDAVWIKNFGGTGVLPVVTLNAGVAPDGTLTAAQAVFNTGVGTTSGDISLLEQYSVGKATIGTTYSSGVWIKGTSGQKIQVRHQAASGYTVYILTGNWDYIFQNEVSAVTAAILDIGLRQNVNGTINSNITVLLWHPDLRPTNTTNFLPAYQRVNTTTDFTPATATITGLGAYPKRTTYTYTPTAGTLTLTVSGTVQYANDEVGAFATSYIPTAGTALSRAADQASMTGTNFSSWYNQSEGSFFAVYNGGRESPAGGYGRVVASMNSGGTFLESNGSANSVSSWNGSKTTALNSVGDMWDTGGKAGMSYSITSTILSVNGVSITNTDLPTWSTLISNSIGIGGPVYYLNGHIRKLTYYPKALTSVELQGLTS